MASRRRLREAKEKTFRGNSGTDYRARYFNAPWRDAEEYPGEDDDA